MALLTSSTTATEAVLNPDSWPVDSDIRLGIESGGAAGPAIEGNSLINWVNQGTILGDTLA